MRGMVLTALIILSALAASVSAPVCAGEPSSRHDSMTLSEAIDISLSKNPMIAAARAGVNATEAQITQARSGFFPQVNASETFQRTTNPMWAFGTKLNQETITQEDFDPARLNNPPPINNFNSAVNLAWPLFDSGQTWYGTKEAKLARQSEEMTLERTRQQIIDQTIQTYLGLVLARENVTVTEHALETARAHLKIVDNSFRQGLAVKSDVLRAQVHIAELEQNMVEAASSVSVAQASLSAVMGVYMAQPVEPVTPLIRKTASEKPLDDHIRTAMEKRPDLRQLEYQVEMAQYEIKKSRAAYLPSVNLNGSYELNSEEYHDTADNYTIGAGVTLNLFSGFRYSAKTREALSRHQQIIEMRNATKQRVRLEVEQAYYAIRSAEKRIDAARTAVSQAQEAMRIIQNRYKNGLVTIISLLDAELAVYRAGNNLNRTIYDHTTARARLAVAEGILDRKFE